MRLIRKGLERLDRDPMRKWLAMCLTRLARIQGHKIRFYFDGTFWMYEWDAFCLPQSRLLVGLRALDLARVSCCSEPHMLGGKDF